MRYVWQGGSVDTRMGSCKIPRGFLSDGASRVMDLCPAAFFSHDRLYLVPELECTGHHGAMYVRRLNKYQSDIFYGLVLWRHGFKAFAIERPLGLIGFGFLGPWRDYRKQERDAGRQVWAAEITQRRVVPKADCWDFPSNRTVDALHVDG